MPNLVNVTYAQVNLSVIDQAIRLLLAEQILGYAYDPERQQLVKRQSARSGAL